MKTVKSIAQSILALVLVCGCLQAQPNQVAAAAAPGTSTGTAIGTAIKTAVSTAFPGISAIINAIWPGSSTDKKTKTNATDATRTAAQKATQGLQQMSSITSDLDTVTIFLSSCMVAENNVTALRAELKGKTGLTSTEKMQVTHDWNDAKSRLAGLGSASSSIDNITDTYMRVTLRAVVDANKGPIDNITGEIAQGDAALPLLSDDLAKLDAQLSAANALAVEIIGDVSLGLKALKNTAAGAEGATLPTPDQEKAQKAMDATLKSRFPNLSSMLEAEQRK
jgi:hypothetical protein